MGKGFDSVHDLWKQFETVMAGSAEVRTLLEPSPTHLTRSPTVLVPQEAPRGVLERELPAGTDETAILPPGIAPGGGSLPMLGASTSGVSDGARD